MAEKRSGHAVYDFTYHIILVTKYRRPVLTGQVAGRLKAECTRLITEMGGSVSEIETDRDHVHILACLSPARAVTDQINVLKGVTARILRRDYWNEISPMLWGKSLWSESYYIATAGGVTVETLEKYVESQPTDAHKRKYVHSGKYKKISKNASKRGRATEMTK